MTISEIINPWKALGEANRDIAAKNYVMAGLMRDCFDAREEASRRSSELACEQDRVNLLEQRLATMAEIGKRAKSRS